jgi:NitT/TauT family transport system substrate-binding protein
MQSTLSGKTKMKTRTLVGVILVLLATSMGFGLFSCFAGSYSGEMETITIAIPPLEQNALLYIAESREYLARNGLQVVVKEYDSGATAMDAILNGEADIAGAADFPFVGAALDKDPVRIIASSDRFENDLIVARKDRGIETISDLKGKRIGVALNTIAEFCLGRFLNLNGLKLQDVTLVDTSPAQFVTAIVGGQVDAIAAWQPYVNQIEKELSETVVWPAQSSQAVYGVLVARNDWLAQHADSAERFLRSLHEAEDYLVRRPDEARAIVQECLHYDNEYMATVWPQHEFGLSLDVSLVMAMNDEARWMIDNHLVDNSVPDFKEYIYLDGLKAVSPEAVNIVR